MFVTIFYSWCQYYSDFCPLSEICLKNTTLRDLAELPFSGDSSLHWQSGLIVTINDDSRNWTRIPVALDHRDGEAVWCPVVCVRKALLRLLIPLFFFRSKCTQNTEHSWNGTCCGTWTNFGNTSRQVRHSWFREPGRNEPYVCMYVCMWLS
jgi:hypothetical protein